MFIDGSIVDQTSMSVNIDSRQYLHTFLTPGYSLSHH